MNAQLSSTAEMTLMMLGVLTLILVALVLYLITLLARVEQTLWRMSRLLRPEVLRDAEGKPIHQRN